MNFADKITLKTRKIGSPLCLGLDPHSNLIPKIFKKDSYELSIQNIEDFLFEIIGIAKNKIVALKPQVAFFEQWGPDGMSLLVKISKLARENNIPIIMDAKRGDIGSTSEAYAKAWLGQKSYFKANAITINPWMGVETLLPFIELANKTNGGVFILLKTSNPGSRDLQDLKVDGKKVFLHLSEKLSHIIESNLGKSGFSNVGIVVGATKPKEAILIRKALPKALFLIPGYGAQGAKASDALKGLIIKNNVYEGGLINSSREILFPKGSYEQTNFSNWKNMIKFALDQTIRDLRYDPY